MRTPQPSRGTQGAKVPHVPPKQELAQNRLHARVQRSVQQTRAAGLVAPHSVRPGAPQQKIVADLKMPLSEAAKQNKAGIFLKKLRKRKGLTLQELSKLSGIGAGLISEIENGKKPVTFKTLTQITQGMDYQTNIVISEKPKKP